MSPPIRDGSGDSIGSIRLGDGSEISEVRTGAGDVLFSGSAIPDSAIAQDLVAWYRFEDDDARDYASDAEFPNVTWGDSTAYDGTVNGATFQSSGGVTDFANGASSGAFDFNGSNDHIEIFQVGQAVNDYSTAFSFSCAARPHSVTNTDFPRFIGVRDENNPSSTSTDKLLWGFNNGNYDVFFKGTAYTGGSASAAVGSYHHYAFTWDGSTGRYYEDGTELFNFSDSDAKQLPSATSIAQNRAEFFDGNIDDVRIYNKALSASEVNEISDSTIN